MPSGHCDFVENISDNLVGVYIVGLGLICKADTMTEHIVTYCPHIFWNHISACRNAYAREARARLIDARGDAPNDIML